MPRYALTIEYNGAPFSGWQRQVLHPSVQAAIEQAVAKVDPTEPVVQGAGRTDAGVHATGQVAHVDLARDWDAVRLCGALNHHLRPLPVAILRAAPVADDWHARFSATGRRYTYRVICRRAPLTIDHGRGWRVAGPLDIGAMQKAAAHLIGRHDFTTFRSSLCQADSPVRSIDSIWVEGLGDEVRFHVAARSFLHNQVRSIVGTLERVGAGVWPSEQVATALAAQDRAACGPVAPPDGLYLTAVTYPVDPFA